jgi:hypothetical protein
LYYETEDVGEEKEQFYRSPPFRARRWLFYLRALKRVQQHGGKALPKVNLKNINEISKDGMLAPRPASGCPAACACCDAPNPQTNGP